MEELKRTWKLMIQFQWNFWTTTTPTVSVGAKRLFSQHQVGWEAIIISWDSLTFLLAPPLYLLPLSTCCFMSKTRGKTFNIIQYSCFWLLLTFTSLQLIFWFFCPLLAEILFLCTLFWMKSRILLTMYFKDKLFNSF